MSQRRQELYDRIRESSKDEVIVEEMRKLGFWPERGELPADPAEEIQRRGELARKLAKLRQELARMGDEQLMLRQLRKERLAASRAKRKETKERRRQERQDRAQRWLERKNDSIVYLGEGYSAGLGANAAAGPEAEKPRSDEARLRQVVRGAAGRREAEGSGAAQDKAGREEAGLPLLHTPADLAAMLDISLGELRFLAYGRKTSQVSHYIRFEIPKKTGGRRLISAPMARLKEVQHKLLGEILGKVALHDAAHGFVPGRSIVSNARAHLGRKIVINIDLKDFFPTITYRRVRGMFRHLGYSEPLATVMAMLCTEPEIEQVELDGETYYVAQGERRLPQGSPASPAITNIICRRLDKRLIGLAESMGFTYTRYADDITLSGDEPRKVCNVLRGVNDIVAHEGFTVHPDKTRVMRAGRRQEVTGVVVNDELGVNRKELRRFRALMHQVKRDGPEGKRWGASDNLFASMRGFASFVTMVTPAKGRALLDQVDTLAAEHGGYGAPPPRPPKAAPSWQRYQPPELAPDPEEATADAVAEAEDDKGEESSIPGTKSKRRKKRGRGGRRDRNAQRERDGRGEGDGQRANRRDALAGTGDEDDGRIETESEESSGSRIWLIFLLVLVLLILRQLWRLLM